MGAHSPHLCRSCETLYVGCTLYNRIRIISILCNFASKSFCSAVTIGWGPISDEVHIKLCATGLTWILVCDGLWNLLKLYLIFKLTLSHKFISYLCPVICSTCYGSCLQRIQRFWKSLLISLSLHIIYYVLCRSIQDIHTRSSSMVLVGSNWGLKAQAVIDPSL